MIAPTPPAANFDSQLIRVCVREPSSLSNRPEMLDRNIRFFTVRFRNFRGVKIESPSIELPLRRPPNGGQQCRNPRMSRATRPALGHERRLSARRARVSGIELQKNQSAVVEVPGQGPAGPNRLTDNLSGSD